MKEHPPYHAPNIRVLPRLIISEHIRLNRTPHPERAILLRGVGMDEYGIALRHVENDARNCIWLNECTVRFDDGEGVVVDGETNRREGPCVHEADSVPFCPGSVSGLAD